MNIKFIGERTSGNKYLLSQDVVTWLFMSGFTDAAKQLQTQMDNLK